MLTLSQKSLNDGLNAGKADPSKAINLGACQHMAATMMPKGDIESEWVAGCFDGAIASLSRQTGDG